MPKAKLKVPEHLLDFSSSSSDDDKESFIEYLKNAKQMREEKENLKEKVDNWQKKDEQKVSEFVIPKIEVKPPPVSKILTNYQVEEPIDEESIEHSEMLSVN